jgi:hypothetical protein
MMIWSRATRKYGSEAFFSSMTFFFVFMMYGRLPKPILGVGEIAFVHGKVGSGGEERPLRMSNVQKLVSLRHT